MRRSCTIIISTVAFALLLAVSGVLLWQYLPEESRASVASTFIETEEPDYQFFQCLPTDVDCCNGLNNTCDLRLDEILFAGLHNAMAARENGFLLGANHDLSMEKALKYGYRAINVDFGLCGGVPQLYHGSCELGTRNPVDLLSHIVKFVGENPTETIVITVQFTKNSGETDPSNIATLDDLVSVVNAVDGLVDKLYAHPDLSEPWPTLRELQTLGKQIILFHYNVDICYESGCPYGLHDYFVYAEETEFEFATLLEVEETTRSCNVTRGSNVATFFGINLFLALPSRDVAAEINSLSFLQNHVSDCEERNEGNLANIVWVDFWTQGELPVFVQRRNHNRGVTSQQRHDL
ncbi:hypothetical protein FisN_12Hh242 [Fistulifera solaris]|uniref:Phosphatidylinositol-specific phospholipase C X domain-containing protein n=1 Tax=Fistulifera solaris TaxID=1519565 RepID=A0A1Z5KCM7_FISSO|nr:hypothetical protein FisN_12Hh242 [Fistulifera solaris]|eukprot:GAX23668.1 hypothetical protein FisN_12Hh242 [Fistulifera solaris]